MGVTAAIGRDLGPRRTAFAFVYGENYPEAARRRTVTVGRRALGDPRASLGLLSGVGSRTRRADASPWPSACSRPPRRASTPTRAAGPPFVVGYILGVFAGGVFAPGGAAIATEPFPSAVRASAGGWIVVAARRSARIAGLSVFGTGLRRDAARRRLGAAAAFLPGLPSLLFWLRDLPETKGLVLT